MESNPGLMCSIIEINLHKRDYRDYLLWYIIWNCWCQRHSRTERCSTVLAKSPAGTSESAVREGGGEGGRGRGGGGGGGREGGGLVGNAHRRRDVGWRLRGEGAVDPRSAAATAWRACGRHQSRQVGPQIKECDMMHWHLDSLLESKLWAEWANPDSVWNSDSK